MKGIVSEIAKKTVPSDEERLERERIADSVFAKVREVIERFPDIVGLEFGGSFAKGTWLPWDADVDIFVRFKESVTDSEFERISRIVGFEALKDYSPYARYSEHPYVEANVDNTKINVVPFYDVKAGRWRSAADRSTFHTKFMKGALDVEKRNEVRVLKAFFKANGIYGAEMAKQGISGYLTEVLVLEFGSFEGAVRSISEIEEGQVIGKAARNFDSPVVIVDPIDGDRNLAAAISGENLGRLIMICRAFVERPSLKFFERKSPIVSEGYWKNVLAVEFGIESRSPDILWGQIKRAASSLSTQLRQGGFRVLRSKAHTDDRKAWLFFLLESPRIPSAYVKKGPEFFRRESADGFVQKHLEDSEFVWIGDGRINALKTRKHAEVGEFMKDLLSNSIKTCVPQGLQGDFERGFRVSVGGKDMDEPIKEAAGELIATDDALLYFN